MADNNKDNDDYQYVDMDAASPNLDDSLQSVEDEPEIKPSVRRSVFEMDTKRKVLIAITFLFVSILTYKWIASALSSDKPSQVIAQPNTTKQAPTTTIVAEQPTQIIMPEAATTTVNIDERIGKQLSDLEQGLQITRADFLSTNSKMTGLNTSVTQMMAKIDELNQVVAQLTAKIEAQEAERLKARVVVQQRPRSRATLAHRRSNEPSARYFIQAVIPGRAWLVATNGSTLTVREGTVIAGYGMVKLIDSRQGRVLTSSGQVIRFSPEDS